MFENPSRGWQVRNFTTNVPKILDLKSSSEQIFSENWRWVPLLYTSRWTVRSAHTLLMNNCSVNRQSKQLSSQLSNSKSVLAGVFLNVPVFFWSWAASLSLTRDDYVTLHQKEQRMKATGNTNCVYTAFFVDSSKTFLLTALLLTMGKTKPSLCSCSPKSRPFFPRVQTANVGGALNFSLK